MTIPRRLLLAGCAAVVATPARAAGIRVLSGGAVQEAVQAVVAAFQSRTGAPVSVEYAPMGRLQQMLKAGTVADLLVMTPQALDAAVLEGLRLAPERRVLGRSMLGLGIREGAPAPGISTPDISTPEAVRRLILASPVLTYIDPAFGTSGPHVVRMLEGMGIAEEMKPRTRTLPGGRVAELVARGEADLVIHQIAEIVPVAGVAFLGPLPAAINLVTTYQIAATAGASNAALALAEFAVSAEGAKLVEHGGLMPGG